jgi:hypothetical protein
MAAFQRGYGMDSMPSTPAPGQTPGTLGGVPTAPRTQDRVVQYSQQSQFVAGKTFFQTETGWIDSAIQKLREPKQVRIQFGSTEYFDLLKQHPQSAPWLALGQNVQFALGETVYEVYP